MRLTGLSAEGFRNLTGVSMEPCGGVNILYGRNGQGKTSLLEGIWMLSAGSSFRTGHISEVIGFESESALLSMKCFSQNREQEAELRLTKNANGGRKYTVNGVSRRPGEEAFRFPCVVFRPEDLDLVKAGPAQRRELLDTLGSSLSSRYRKTLAEYNRCLAQRNSLLKKIPWREGPDAQSAGLLDVLDAALSRLGVFLIRARKNLLDRLCPSAEELYREISGGAEKFEIQYGSGFGENPLPEDSGQAELVCCERLAACRRTDIGAGFTTLGAHRDDLIFLLDGRPARAFGSQGQQRTAAISCRLASAKVLESYCGESPVILLDDVFSELDPDRCRFILDRVSGCQIFLTGCDLPLLEALTSNEREIRRFRVEGGEAASEKAVPQGI